MRIGIVSNWYRPYYVVASNRTYKVDSIIFYKDNEIIVKSNSGWLEKKTGGDIKEIELPIDKIKTKRKENLEGRVFVISKGKESYGTDIIADLYIPADMLGIHFVEYEIKYQQLRAVYEGEQSIQISTVIKSLTDTLCSIRNEYEQIYKQLDDSSMSITKADIVYENIDKLKELAEKYKAEQKRVHDLTVEDVI